MSIHEISFTLIYCDKSKVNIVSESSSNGVTSFLVAILSAPEQLLSSPELFYLVRSNCFRLQCYCFQLLKNCCVNDVTSCGRSYGAFVF